MTREENVQSFEDINREYDGQWLLLRVIKTERDQIVEGAVLAHDPDRETIAALLPRSQESQPRPSLAFFKARAS